MVWVIEVQIVVEIKGRCVGESKETVGPFIMAPSKAVLIPTSHPHFPRGHAL